MSTIIISIVGMLIGVLATAVETIYMKKRFGERPERKKLVFDVSAAIIINLLCVFIFNSYGYNSVRIVLSMILSSALVIISRCDIEKKIIPNVFLIFLVVIRIAEIVITVFFGMSDLKTVLLSSIGGVISSAAVLLTAKLIQKGAIGMGDIKLFITIGFYLGSSSILPVMLISMVAAMIRGIIGLATKKMSKNDTFSLGPYITAGTMCVMLLGI